MSELPVTIHQSVIDVLPRYMKLGLQGVSLIWASGDSGVAGPGSRSDSNGCIGSKATVFSPTWPNK